MFVLFAVQIAAFFFSKIRQLFIHVSEVMEDFFQENDFQ